MSLDNLLCRRLLPMEPPAGHSIKQEVSLSSASSSSTTPKQQQRPAPTNTTTSSSDTSPGTGTNTDASKNKPRRSRNDAAEDSTKRRCVSTACVACRKRKSKCDGNTPSCAACASVYGTACVYDPNSDHRRKGVYKKDIDNLKTHNSTLQTLISAILNYPQDQVPELVRQIRACESLDRVADAIAAKENGEELDTPNESPTSLSADTDPLSFEHQLSSKVGELRLEDGSVRFIGGTSNLLYGDATNGDSDADADADMLMGQPKEQAVTSWTTVTSNPDVILHLLNMYFAWHYTFFTTLSKGLFWRDFYRGKTEGMKRKTEYCSPLLVNSMLALGCHFSSSPAAREDPDDSATAGDHFFKEAKRLINEGDEYEKPRITTVQALALMSVREAGCGREPRGWVYSGISFRMACDLGINFESEGLAAKDSSMDDEEEDVRRITFWGCFLFDKCWSNYLGRLPLFQTSNNVTVPKFDVFPDEDAATWAPYTDSGSTRANAQPSRVRAVALQISALCEISSDLMKFFYHPQEKSPSKQAELKRLSDIHTRLETWRRNLAKEMEPREGGLPSVLLMHMFFQLLYIHLFRPFLKYSPGNSPLPSHVSPRKLCTNAAGTISKLFRLYKRSYGLRQICNIAVYIAHSACTIHLLNLPEKNAKRDISHGVRHLEEIADGWLCARRTLSVISLQARRWNIELPDDAAQTLARTDAKFGTLGSPRSPVDSEKERQQKEQHDNAVNSMSMSSQAQGMWGGSSHFLPDYYDASLTNMASAMQPQQTVPQNLSAMSLRNGLQGYTSLQNQDNNAGQAQNVNAAYQNLLQQQQAWSEAAARNGIPIPPAYGQQHAGLPLPPVHPPRPPLSPPSSVFDNRTANGGFAHPGQQQNGYDLDSQAPHGQAYEQQHRSASMSGRSQPQRPPPSRRPSQIASTPSSSYEASSSLSMMNTTHRTFHPQASSGQQQQQQQHQTRARIQTQPRSQQQLAQHDATNSNTKAASTSQKRGRASPSSMFGGVEALLKEGQDWWVEDQAQVASGFNNWELIASRRGSVVGNTSAGLSAPTSQTVSNGIAGGQHEPRRLSGGGSGLDLSSLGMGGAGYDDADWFN